MSNPPNCVEMSGQSPNRTAHLPKLTKLSEIHGVAISMTCIASKSPLPQTKTGQGKFQLTVMVHPGDTAHERHIVVSGRAGWALNELVKAGPAGCSAADFTAGLRLAHFVYLLRHEYELVIETEHEAHGGQFPGSHAVYRLKSPVRILDDSRQAAA
ncbi:hypothetical protein N7E70_018310 [Aminobacter sp. NyZ550]|uniref:winged helix domain-containing protein n=1 Tax=Aminobacter sp. NyZ550 TaxID=2979870 RepID=UPI0021D5829F|nr:hypothetical protein [Aminobacter sp. NyZ550]WAX93630.1 hypothetical protein N7E70_018310 [Aminobacter sp. NyZ550]